MLLRRAVHQLEDQCHHRRAVQAQVVLHQAEHRMLTVAATQEQARALQDKAVAGMAILRDMQKQEARAIKTAAALLHPDHQTNLETANSL